MKAALHVSSPPQRKPRYAFHVFLACPPAALTGNCEAGPQKVGISGYQWVFFLLIGRSPKHVGKRLRPHVPPRLVASSAGMEPCDMEEAELDFSLGAKRKAKAQGVYMNNVQIRTQVLSPRF